MAELLTETYRLRADAEVVDGDDGAPALAQSRFRLPLGRLSIGCHALVLRLAEDWCSDAELGQVVAGVEGIERILQGQMLLRRLASHSWLQRRLGLPGRPLLGLVPRSLGAPGAALPAPPQGAALRLSRFAMLRSADHGGGVLVAETPRGTWSVELLDPQLAAVLAGAAAAPVDAAGVAATIGIGEIAAARLLDELARTGLLLDAESAAAERESLPLAAWAPQELLLHERSRAGHHVLPLGGTFPLRGRFDAAPIDHRYPDAPAVELPVPDLDVVAKTDPTLTEVIERRSSIREHDDAAPIALDQLAEFLYRVQRLVGADRGGVPQAGRRPYPSGGALCELELYPVVTLCDGLDPGVYHYDSTDHRLERLADLGPPAARLLRYVSAAATMTQAPQVCLVVTARVDRLLWKYEGMGYPLLLKHAGVLTGLMYLVATAMDLAPCAVGAGDGAAFAEAVGVDALAEPSVAEFLLGSRRAR